MFSQARVRFLADVVITYHTGAGMVESAAHILGHTTAKAARLKEEA